MSQRALGRLVAVLLLASLVENWSLFGFLVRAREPVLMITSAYFRSMLMAGCLLAIAHPTAVAQQARACTPVSGKLPTNATARGLAGDYHLTIIGTDGEATGKMVRGDLKLWAPPDSFRHIRQLDGKRNPHVTTPLIGRTDIRTQDVGGVEDGGWGATEPEAPGIAVREHHASYQGQPFTEITLLLGAEGNRRGVVRFDGPYNALYVDRIDDSGFYGRWHASLGYTTYKAEGFFCGVKKR